MFEIIKPCGATPHGLFSTPAPTEMVYGEAYFYSMARLFLFGIFAFRLSFFSRLNFPSSMEVSLVTGGLLIFLRLPLLSYGAPERVTCDKNCLKTPLTRIPMEILFGSYVGELQKPRGGGPIFFSAGGGS